MNTLIKYVLAFFVIPVTRAMFAFSIQGVIGSWKDGSQFINTNRTHIEMDDVIHKLDLDKTPLLMLLNKLGKKAVGKVKFEWQTKERKADYITPTAFGGNWAAGAAADGTITVSSDDKYLFAEGDIIQVPSISQTVNIYVHASNQTTGVLTCYTVSGNLDFSAPGSPLPVILRLGNAFEIGSGMGTIKSQQPDEEYNYLQIFQTPIGITTTADNLNYRGVDEWAEQANEAGVDHAFMIEKTMFFGQRYLLNAGRMNGIYRQHFTGGVRQYVSTNVTNVAGNLTQESWVDWLNDFTRYSKQPIVFAGEIIFEALWQWADGKIQITQDESTLGIAIMSYKTPYGKLVNVVPHRELLTNEYQGVGFGIDLDDIEYCYLKGKRSLDTHIVTNIQQPDLKQRIDEYRTWAGLKLIQEKKHAYIYGVTGITT